MTQSAVVAQQIEGLVAKLQAEGTLNDQFVQLQELQDESNPDFVAEVVELYFEDSGAKIDRIGVMLSSPNPDFNELDQLVHQFKGSSASLGAQLIAQLCIRLREHCQQRDVAGCSMVQQQIKQAYADLKSKLELFMGLEAQRKQFLAAGC